MCGFGSGFPNRRTCLDSGTSASSREPRPEGQVRPGGLTLALELGLLVRLSFVAAADFPLNDGGLFVSMARQIRLAGGALPWTVPYNGEPIPFVYPPLPFYLAALVAGDSVATLLAFERWFPLVVSMLTIVAFWLLARELLRSRTASDLATITFAILPLSYLWVIMGGGITRAPGLLFAILASWQAYRMFTSTDRQSPWLTAILSALTLLCHPEAALFVVLTIAVFWAVLGLHRSGTIKVALVAAGTAVLSAPWWLVAIIRHGVAVLLPVGEPGFGRLGVLLNPFFLGLTSDARFPALALMVLLGLAYVLSKRQYLLPLWAGVDYVLMARAPGQKALIPLALMAGLGARYVLLPLLQQRESAAAQGDRVRGSVNLATVFLGALVVQTVALDVLSYRPLLSPLPLAERQAMAWAQANTPQGSRFVVVTGEGGWPQDRSSEWFPTLSERISVATVQGGEWLDDLNGRIEAYKRLQECAGEDGDCLSRWSASYDRPFDYIYVVKRPPVVSSAALNVDACAGLRSELRHDPSYEVVYEGEGALIARPR